MKLSEHTISKYKGLVDREDRERLHGHRGAAVWFTGFSASGKSTLSHWVEKELHESGCSTYVLDGDNVRFGLCADLGFTREDRAENIRRIGEMVNLFVDAGIIVLTAFISPFKADRDKVRDIVGEDRYIEVFMDCPIEVCLGRDPKGIYAKAVKGDIPNFTGISSPYEPPLNPDIVIRPHIEPIDESVQKIVRYLKERHFIR